MAGPGDKLELTERERLILGAIVDDYIASGDPVGSRTITKRPEVVLSAATIRNVMADLEELGLLRQPHTSAGRIPTDRGFRFYVDSLVKMREPTPGEQDRLAGSVRLGEGLQQVLEDATHLLSALSRHTGVMLAPRRSPARFHHLEFVRLPDERILVIMVDQAGQVQNKILEPEQGRALHQAELDALGTHLNARCRGFSLAEARERLLQEMRQARTEVNVIMGQALSLTDRVLAQAERGPKDVILAGETHVLEAPELADVERIRGLLKTFEERNLLVRLLDRMELADEVQVFIGRENPYQEVADCSVVAATYGAGGQALGVIGVIGPMRMDYARVVPLVEFTAQVVSRVVQGR